MIEAVVYADNIGMTACEILAVNEDVTYKIQRTDSKEPSDVIVSNIFWAECAQVFWEYWDYCK